MYSMLHKRPHGLLKRLTLSEPEVLLIKQLAQVCENYESLHMPLSWSDLLRRSGDAIRDFLYYVDGELVGYLTLDDTNHTVSDLVGMVHPAHRRQGIFRQLLHAARQECRARSQARLVLVCEQASHSGQAFVQTIAATRAASEHLMFLTDFQECQVFDERLAFRKAESSDLSTIVNIQAASFHAPEDSARLFVLRQAHDPRCSYYLMTYGEEPTGCQESVGVLRLDDKDDAIGIFSLGILPDYQGRGYGRQLLEEAIRAVHSYSHAPIFLFVDIENVRASSLYRSCGFTIKTTYDYYILNA
ncbi:MAG: GNAT family N-acetyltransferase [Ktedonobacteraceae bacterium]